MRHRLVWHGWAADGVVVFRRPQAAGEGPLEVPPIAIALPPSTQSQLIRIRLSAGGSGLPFNNFLEF